MGKPKAKQKIKITAWDAAAYLKTDDDIAHYLEAVFEDGEPTLVAAALGDRDVPASLSSPPKRHHIAHEETRRYEVFRCGPAAIACRRPYCGTFVTVSGYRRQREIHGNTRTRRRVIRWDSTAVDNVLGNTIVKPLADDERGTPHTCDHVRRRGHTLVAGLARKHAQAVCATGRRALDVSTSARPDCRR